jgi:hypothetical protein
MQAHFVKDNSKQVTIYTCVVHVGTSTGKRTLSIAVISDGAAHTSLEVAVFNDKIIRYLRDKFDVNQLHVWTDGAAAHFKNYKTMSLCSLYGQEYNLDHVDWNFQVRFYIHIFQLRQVLSKCKPFILIYDI